MVLMASNTFPLENMCYSLFMDIIQWYSSSSTTEMRYSENVGDRTQGQNDPRLRVK